MPHELLGKTMSEISDSDLFQDGKSVTNIKVVGNGTACFSKTNCTVFDYYYIFTRGDELINATDMFREVKNSDYGRFY